MVRYVVVPRMRVSVMSFKPLLMLPLLLFAVKAVATDIFTEKMFRLDRQGYGEVQDLSLLKGKPMIASFFMPNCRWCQRQHKALKLVSESCPELQSVMLGVNGTRNALRKELKREQNQFAAYIASNNIVQAIGDKSPVPMMLIFNREGKLMLNTVGYRDQASLRTLLTKHGVANCIS